MEVQTDGTLSLTDRRSGRTFSGLLVFEDIGDRGDEYDFSPVGSVQTSVGHLAVARTGGATLLVQFEMTVPSALDEQDRGKRADATRAISPFVIVTLTPDSPVVHLECNAQGNNRENRLRLLFPGLARSDRVLSDGHFYINERTTDRPSDEGFVQPHADTFPQQDFSVVQDETGGMAVFVQGLPEVAPVLSDDGTLGLAVTLQRSVEWLSRDDFPTRRHQNAGPTIYTPGGPLAESGIYRLALVPFSGDWRAAGIRRLSERWRRPPLVIQGVEDGEQPSPGDFVTVDDPLVSVTAIKRHEERDTLVVRMFNDTPDPRDAVVRLGPKVSGAWRVDLLERRQGELTVTDEHDVIVPLRKHGIATVEIAIRSQDNFGGVRR